MNRKLDARPDRIDLRDRIYQPRLVNLPVQYPSKTHISNFLPLYKELILDQKDNGACTGFGLAAVINYLLWSEKIKKLLVTSKRKEGVPSSKTLQSLPDIFVSPQMLFTLAKYYDEWKDNDNNSSSCRGAVKGWHYHGVCQERTWPDPVSFQNYRNKKYDGKSFIAPDKGWEEEAARIPLGAYYRINKSSISDMQAAIAEVGAIYASAYVNERWQNEQLEPIENSEKEYGLALKRISFGSTQEGGHAFAIIGYCADGFVIQNSWGKEWGTFGFAVLTYEGWAYHGKDAWVAVMGAPTKAEGDYLVSSRKNGLEGWLRSRTKGTETVTGTYNHLIEISFKGDAYNNFIDQKDGATTLKDIIFQSITDQVLHSDKAQKYQHLAIIADSGMKNSTDTMADYDRMLALFIKNGIYPIFLTWKNSIGNKICAVLEKNSPSNLPEKSNYEWDAEARDRYLELACREELVKSIWDDHKNAAYRSGKHTKWCCTRLLADYLTEKAEDLKKNNVQLHLVGFSAGSLLIGRLLDRMKLDKKADSLHLLMPTCSMEFANKNFLPVLEKDAIPLDGIHFILQDYRLELEDEFGPYQKSFLYLVSRSLEEHHKTPLLGIQLAWLDDTVRDKLENLGSSVRRSFEDSVNRSLAEQQKTQSLGMQLALLDNEFRVEMGALGGIDEKSSMMTWANVAAETQIGRWLKVIKNKKLKPYCYIHEKSCGKRNSLLATAVKPGEKRGSDELISHDSLATNSSLVHKLVNGIISNTW
jgi:hypothetical protein